jgi:hypothetical protein
MLPNPFFVKINAWPVRWENVIQKFAPFLQFLITNQCKQPPNSRTFAQSGHPVHYLGHFYLFTCLIYVLRKTTFLLFVTRRSVFAVSSSVHLCLCLFLFQSFCPSVRTFCLLSIDTFFCLPVSGWWLLTGGVAEKHDFRGIQRKIPQNPDFAQKQDLNPVPHG